jgi:hypothetical protein
MFIGECSNILITTKIIYNFGYDWNIFIWETYLKQYKLIRNERSRRANMVNHLHDYFITRVILAFMSYNFAKVFRHKLYNYSLLHYLLLSSIVFSINNKFVLVQNNTQLEILIFVWKLFHLKQNIFNEQQRFYWKYLNNKKKK